MQTQSILVLPLTLALVACFEPDPRVSDAETDEVSDDEAAPAAPPDAAPPSRTSTQPPASSAPEPSPEPGPQPQPDGDGSPATPGPRCPTGTTWDGIGCGSWSPVPSRCTGFDEPVSDGRAYGARCELLSPLGGAYLASAWVDPSGGTLVDLPTGTLAFRDPVDSSIESDVRAETWSRDDAGAWTQRTGPARIELPTAAVALDDHRVLVVGCADRRPCDVGLVEIYDAERDAWDATFTMPVGAIYAVALTLPDGDALVVSGGAAARLDLASGSWEVGPIVGAAMDAPAVAPTSDGRVLVVGGSLYGWERRAYLLDTETLAWRRTADPTLYTFMNRAVRAAGGVTLFGSGSIDGLGAEVYRSVAP